MVGKAHRLVLLDPLPPKDFTFAEHRKVLESYFRTHRPGGIQVRFAAPRSTDSSELVELAARAQYWLVINRPVSKSLIESSPQLKYIHKIGAGLDPRSVETAVQRGIIVSGSPHAGHLAVAEHTFLLMLALGKDLLRLHNDTAEGSNPRGLKPLLTSQGECYFNFLGVQQNRFTQLHDKTLGLIGLGEIGREVASRAHAFGMRILYLKRERLSPEQETALGLEFADLPTLLHRSDFVSIHTRQTPETTRLIGVHELSIMRSTAYLINTSRGNIIDEAALVEALQNKRIAGAGLDVFSIEPLQPSNPLLQFPNVILTPHVAFRGPVIDWYARFISDLDAFICNLMKT